MTDEKSGTPTRGTIPPMNRQLTIAVNKRRCRNCVFGPESFATPEVREECERKPAGAKIVNCHNAPDSVCCRGFYDHHKEEIEAASLFPVEYVDVPDVLAQPKPATLTPAVAWSVPMPEYADQVAEAKLRSADHEKHEALHRDERNALIAQAAQEVFRELVRQAGDGGIAGITVTMSQPPLADRGRFGLSLTDSDNTISYDIAGGVEYASNFEEVHRRLLRVELAIRARHSSGDKESAPLVVVVYHFRFDGSFEIDLSMALVESAKKLLAVRT